MLALQMYRSAPKQVTARALGGAGRWVGTTLPGLLVGPVAPLRLVTIDEPAVHGAGWARLRPRLSGICGSDLAAVTGSVGSYVAALTSLPYVPGHEVVGELLDACEDLPAGTRVVVDPVLACAARGLPACGPCADGGTNRCDRITVGSISPGMRTGFCADTGGGWGEQLAAHRSQLHAVPDGLPDERAVLIEPLACAVHLARRAEVPAGGSVLVAGAGAAGLFAVLALRELTAAGRITVVAKHPQQREWAMAFGATDVVGTGEAVRAVRRATQALRVPAGPLTVRTASWAAPSGPWARRDQQTLLGGVDVAVDCVGTPATTDLALCTTRAGGRVVLSGMPVPGADLSPAWFRELSVAGTYASNGDDFAVAMDLAGRAPLAGVVSGRYPLRRWREALDHASSVGRLGGVKVCFDVRDRR